MQIELVDERTARWEVHRPTYRVFFWERGFGPPEVPRESVMYGCEVYDVSEAEDVFEVLAWASANSGARKGVIYPESDRTFALYAVVAVGERLGTVRLAGVDPTRAT
jgi:hypothetical protein